MIEIAQFVGKVLAFAIDASSAEIVKLETLEASGARQERSEEEKATLAQSGTEVVWRNSSNARRLLMAHLLREREEA